jgi:hypothetical protein
MNKRMKYSYTVFLLIILITAQGNASDRAGEEIDWFVISSGGTHGNSASYEMDATAGQTAVSYGKSLTYMLTHGFWQDFSTGGVTVDCGDSNEDGAINIKDITYLIKYKYKGGAAPIPYICVGDVNNDDSVNIKDITDLIKYKYKGGDPPDPNCCNPVW